ncbi:MAG: hypothetical protein ACTSR8_20290 [Promethearchaeota archaeon]
MTEIKDFIQFFKNRGGVILALVSLILYILMVFTFVVFVSSILLLILIIAIPLIIISIIKKDKNLIKRRCKASCWAIGFLILFMFPAFWLIPQQMYIRVNRQQTLITPDVQAVEGFAKKFLEEHEDYKNMTFKEKAEAISIFTTQNIKWRLDYETYGMSGHVATPEQCIELGEDDCQGQAVTMASLLIHLNFKYVWVVETPFHWYVIVRDPGKGKLEGGWEKKVELYQENGELLPLNRDGEGNMPDWRLEEVVLIFNNKETLYPVNPLEALWISWTATAFFYDDFFPIFFSYQIIFLIIGMFLLAIPLTLWTYYMSNLTDSQRDQDKKVALKILFKRVIILGSLLFLVFLIWFFVQTIIWDYTLILAISEISLISILASEPRFWRLIKIGNN